MSEVIHKEGESARNAVDGGVIKSLVILPEGFRSNSIARNSIKHNKELVVEGSQSNISMDFPVTKAADADS